MGGEVHDGAKLPETIARAFYIAQSGTPGPVIVSLPEDMLSDMIENEVVSPHRRRTPHRRAATSRQRRH